MSEKELRMITGEPPKKRYSPPELREYGSVSKLTRGGSFVGNDGNTKCDTGQASSHPGVCS